jgi:hypothetical protein
MISASKCKLATYWAHTVSEVGGTLELERCTGLEIRKSVGTVSQGLARESSHARVAL